MEPQTNEKTKKKRKKRTGYTCCAVGCGSALLLFVVFVILFLHAVNHTEFGENEATSPIYYTEKGSNFSYYVSHLHRCCEFTISEQDFLEWCKERWEPIEIETLPSPPKTKLWHERDEDDFPIINEQRKVPLRIERYSYVKPEHEKCWSLNCQVDPTEKTDAACFRSVDDGYYYEQRRQTSGGVYILYDRSNQRCYIDWSRR